MMMVSDAYQKAQDQATKPIILITNSMHQTLKH